MTALIKARRGIALIAMLSLIAAMGMIVATLSSVSRDSRLASLNRTTQTRGVWAADGCAAVVIEHVDALLSTARGPNEVNGIWSVLDTTLSSVRLPNGWACTASFIPSGTTLPVNAITEAELRALLGSSALPDQRDSLVDAFMDWRDVDTLARDSGAEGDWYLAASRPKPRDGAFRHVDEVRGVRGWEHSEFINDLSMEQHRIVLDRASRALLSTIEGLTPEAVEWIGGHRLLLRGQDPSAIIDHVSIASQTIIANHYAHLRSISAPAPDVWYLECAVPAPNGRGARVRLSLVRAGNHAVIVKRWEGFL